MTMRRFLINACIAYLILTAVRLVVAFLGG